MVLSLSFSQVFCQNNLTFGNVAIGAAVGTIEPVIAAGASALTSSTAGVDSAGVDSAGVASAGVASAGVASSKTISVDAIGAFSVTTTSTSDSAAG